MRITFTILATMLSLCTNPAVSFGDTGGWFGIVAGTMTAAFAISVPQSDSDLKGVSTAGIVLGALAAGLGAANLYLARRGDAFRTDCAGTDTLRDGRPTRARHCTSRPFLAA